MQGSPRNPSEVPHDICAQLSRLMASDLRTEKECKKLLTYAADWLCEETVIEVTDFQTERRGHTGDCDCIVLARIRESTGGPANVAYVWEIKAPQCFLFEKETNTRLLPSDELIKAENQVLHYHDEIQNNAGARHTLGVTHADYVRLGPEQA